MFRLLGVHPGPDITVPAAASLAAVSPEQARHALSDLTAASLLAERVPGRYAFHDLLRTYAASLARRHDGGTEPREALRRSVDHYQQSLTAAAPQLRPGWNAHQARTPCDGVVPEHFTSHQQALDWCRAEKPVLLSVTAQAASAGLEQQTTRIAGALSAFLELTKDWQKWEWAEQTGLQAARRAGDVLAAANAHAGLGKLHAARGSYPRAHRHLARARALMEQLGDQPRISNINLSIAITLGLERRFTEAIEYASLAARLCPPDNHQRQAGILNALGWFHASLDDHHQALALCRRALDLARTARDVSTEAAVLDSLGYIHQRCGRYPESGADLRRAARLREALGEHFDLAGTLTRLGDTSDAAWQPRLSPRGVGTRRQDPRRPPAP